MKESKDRTEQFMYSTSAAAAQAPSSTRPLAPFNCSLSAESVLFNHNDPMGDGSPSRFDSKGKGRAPQDGDVLALNLESAEEGVPNGNQAFMQMQMVEQQVRL